MITKEEITKSFMEELQAELEIVEVSKSYYAESHMEVTIPGKYGDGEVLQEYTEIQLGTHVFPNKKD